MIFRSLMTSHNPNLDIYNADAANAHASSEDVRDLLGQGGPGVGGGQVAVGDEHHEDQPGVEAEAVG